jgi:osmotically-inducible protein OsmY
MLVADKLSALRIKANIIADKGIGLMDVEVEVEDHVAVLRGEVQTEEQKQLAEELAYEIEEIDEVINEIRVVAASEPQNDAHLGYGLAEGDAGETPFVLGSELVAPGSRLPASEQFPGEFTDDQIEQEVRDKLAEQNLIDTSEVTVKSVNQVVHLGGSVKIDLRNLKDLILNVRGVMGVSSNVTDNEDGAGTPTQ